MEISQKNFNELTKLMSSMTKTLKNFDDRLNEVENNLTEVAETVTVELPKAIAEQVGTAVDSAVAESNVANGEGEETVADEEAVVAETAPDAAANAPAEEVCPDCGNSPCTCGAEAPVEGQEFCGDSDSFEEFSEKVTKTIEDLSVNVNDLVDRVNKMFVKVFSEGDDQVNAVTNGEEDVQTVEKDLEESPKEFVAEEEAQITDEKKPEVKAEVVVAEVKPEAVNENPVVAPAPEAGANFSAKDRYNTVKNIFNL